MNPRRYPFRSRDNPKDFLAHPLTLAPYVQQSYKTIKRFSFAKSSIIEPFSCADLTRGLLQAQ